MVAHPVRSRLRPRTGCRTQRGSDYYFFFAAFFFAGFLAAAFVAFFFVAILSLLNGPFGWRPLASNTPIIVARPRTKTIRRICSYTIFLRECSTSFEAINDSFSDSLHRNRRHRDRVVLLIERAQHREEVGGRLLHVAANRKVERR